MPYAPQWPSCPTGRTRPRERPAFGPLLPPACARSPALGTRVSRTFASNESSTAGRSGVVVPYLRPGIARSTGSAAVGTMAGVRSPPRPLAPRRCGRERCGRPTAAQAATAANALSMSDRERPSAVETIEGGAPLLLGAGESRRRLTERAREAVPETLLTSDELARASRAEVPPVGP